MKKSLLPLLLCAAMLLSLASCAAERYDLLYSTEENALTYCVRGTSNRPRQLIIKNGDEIVWNEKVKIDSSVGSQGGNYGFEVLDLNFDGYLDFMIADDIAGDCLSYLCWLYDPASEDYVLSESLTGLCNVKANATLQAIFGYTHTYEEQEAYLDVPASHTTTDSATKYEWKEGELTPTIRVSITYYSESGLYCYSVAYYDEETKDFGASDDKWLTAEEYETYDMSFLYYFKDPN